MSSLSETLSRSRSTLSRKRQSTIYGGSLNSGTRGESTRLPSGGMGSIDVASPVTPNIPKWDPADADYLDHLYSETNSGDIDASNFDGKRGVLDAASEQDMKELQRLYSSNFARMRDESKTFLDRSQRLYKLGVDSGSIDFFEQYGSILSLGDKRPWRELSVAVLGSSGTGKSTLVSKLMGRPGLLGGTSTKHNYAIVHVKSASLYSANHSNAANSTVVVSHRIDHYDTITFYDTIPLDSWEREESTPLNTTTHRIQLSGLNPSDPSVVGVAVNAPKEDSTVPPTLPTLATWLSKEAVDIALVCVTHQQLDLPQQTNIKNVLNSITIPILVITHIDEVWDALSGSARDDEILTEEYRKWKKNVSATLTNNFGVGEFNQFFVSCTRDSPLNELTELQHFLEELSKRRKNVKTLTSVRTLGLLLGEFEDNTSRTIVEIHKASSRLDSMLTNINDELSQSNSGDLFGPVIARSFFTALRDLSLPENLEYVTNLQQLRRPHTHHATTEMFNHNTFHGSTAVNPIVDTVETCAAQENPFLVGRCYELGLGSNPTPGHSNAATAQPRTQRSRQRLQPSPLSASFNAELSNNTSSYIRSMSDTEQFQSTYSAAATLALSHSHRPSAESLRGNPRNAMKYLQLAAAKGNPAARAELGRSYEIGDCVDRDLNQAMHWYSKASEQGDPSAILGLARLLETNADSVNTPQKPSLFHRPPANISKAVELLEGLAKRSQEMYLGGAEVEAAFELARIFADNGPLPNVKKAQYWREEGHRLWRVRCQQLLARVWSIIGGSDPALKTPKGLASFLNRLQDQLRLHMAVYRSTIAARVRVGASVGSTRKLSRRQEVGMIQAALRSWTAGTMDEEADMELDPSVYTSSMIGSTLQECLTVAFPGLTETSTLAGLLIQLWLSGSGQAPAPAPSHFNQFPILARWLEATIGNSGAEFASELADLFQSQFSMSTNRLRASLSFSINLYKDQLNKETKLWTKRRDWASMVANDCRARLSKMDKYASEKIVRSIRVVQAAQAAKEARSLAAISEGPTAGITENNAPLNIVNLSKLPFVWEGASVAMGSQLLDEVTGSFSQSLYTWNEEAASSVVLTPLAIRIDRLLDNGLAAYSDQQVTMDSSAIKLWQEAQRLAEENRDLIREANALCNIGCASRMMGRYQTSIQYLDLAWRKSCAYVSLASRQIPDSLSINLVKGSLNTGLANVNSHNLLIERGGVARAPALQIKDWSHAIGPAVTVWFMRLLVSLGHAHLAVGGADIAGEWYDGCIRLCKETLSKAPDAPSIDEISGQAGIESLMIGKKAKPARTKKLSYLQRTTVLLLVRSLTHRGLCFSALGDMDEAVRCQHEALGLLGTYGPSIGSPETTYRAAVEANLGNIHHARGRLAAAVSHHARSAMLFLQVEDHHAQARELANLGALWVEIGKTLRSLEWLQNADESLANIIKSNKDIQPPHQKQLIKPKENKVVLDQLYRVREAHERQTDLDMDLKVGEWVKVIMVMEDGISALGQKEGDWSGTFPLSCLEGVGEPLEGSSDAAGGEISSYTDLLLKLSDAMALRSTVTSRPSSNKSEGLDAMDHCGTPYIEFGLGLLKDVVQLGCETPEVAINIASAEILLNQPYRGIQNLLRLVEGSRFAGSIPLSLRKPVSLILSSAFLMIALANEDPSMQLQFWPDGSSRFLDSHSVSSRSLNLLLSSLGVSSSIDISKLTRADVFPILQACFNMPSSVVSDGETFNEFFSGPIGPLDAMVSSILGTLEIITSIWIEVVYPDEAIQWREMGSRRIEDAIEKQAFAVSLFGEEEGCGVDGRKLGGDAGVFTVAASLALIEADRKRQKQIRQEQNQPGAGTAQFESGVLEDIVASNGSAFTTGSPDLIVWSWAVNNSRLQVCSKCAASALETSIMGGKDTTMSPLSTEVGSGAEPFPCQHNRNIEDAMLGMVLSETRDSISLGKKAAEASPEKDPLAAAAEEVMGAMVRRATRGRLKDLEKARLEERRLRNLNSGRQPKPALATRLEGDQPPAWMEIAVKEMQAAGDKKGARLLPGEDIVMLLKKLAVMDGEADSDSKNPDLNVKTRQWFKRGDTTWADLFYSDASEAVKRRSNLAEMQ